MKAKRILAILLCLVLIASSSGFKPVGADEQEKKELTKTISGSAQLELDDKNPEGNDPDDTSNPYGVTYDPNGTGMGDVMVPWNELAVLKESGDTDGIIRSYNIYMWDKGEKKSAVFAEFQVFYDAAKIGSFLNNPDSNKLYGMNYVQSVSFAGKGSTSKSVIAYAGFNPNDNQYQIVATVPGLAMTSFSDRNVLTYWVKEDSEYKEYKALPAHSQKKYASVCKHYMANNYLTMTAGDFGRGYETVIVLGEFCARDGSDGTVIIMFEYGYTEKGFERIGEPVILGETTSKEYVSTLSAVAGDINGDDVDELAVVIGKAKFSSDPKKGEGETQLLVFPGIRNEQSLVAKRTPTTTTLYKDDGKERYTFSSPGISIGDVDGDGKNEVVVGGYTLVSKNGGAYKSQEAQLLGIYKKNEAGEMSTVILTDPGMNTWSKGGYYEDDAIHPRSALATVAFNGQNGKDLIFFNGDIFTYTPDKGVALTYTPDYFTKTDAGATSADGKHSASITNSWISDVAVGNFDRNEPGREQIYFSIALKESGYENYYFKVGMIGATYSDTEEYLASITGRGNFYSTINSGYELEDADGELTALSNKNWSKYCSSHIVLTAFDSKDINDGVRMRYRGKSVIYTDPAVEAVLQAAPYIEGIQDSGSTAYTVTTSYGKTDNTTISLDWGVGFTGEAEIRAIAGAKTALQTGAAFNYTWEWEDGWTKSYSSSFETTDQNTVLIQRTPIVFYNYDMYDAQNGKWIENAVQVPMPLGPVWSQLTISDYNAFVDEYDAMVEKNKEKAKSLGLDYDAPVLKKIVDTDSSANDNGEYLLDNEGKPEAYLSDWNNGDLTDAEKLSKTGDMELGYAGTTKTQEYEYEQSHSEGEGFSGGFSINYSLMFGADAVLAKAVAGFYVSVDFMKGTCSYETTTRGNTVSGTVTDLNAKKLMDNGIEEDVIKSYYYTWSFGRWYIDLGTGHSDPKAEEDLTMEVWDNSHVPVYGYKVANMSKTTRPVELSLSVNDGIFTFTWHDPDPDTTDGYYVYQVMNDGYVQLNRDRISKSASSFSVPHTALDTSAGYLFRFVATSSMDLPDNRMIQSLWSNEVTYVPAVSGPEGPEGPQGPEGPAGQDGKDGKDGANGKSAYEIAVENGYTGTLNEWIESIKGEQGNKGADGRGIISIEKTSSDGNIDTYTITYTDNTTSVFTIKNGIDGQDGKNGVDGKDGKDGENGTNGQNGNDGKDGQSGTVENGATGARGEKGDKGDTGATGAQGEKGDKGDRGETGATGAQGEKGDRGETGATGAQGEKGDKGDKGDAGKDGVSISEVKIENGSLIVTFSDGKVVNAGTVVSEVDDIDDEKTPLSEPGTGEKTNTEKEKEKTTERDIVSKSDSSVPWWVIYILIGSNVLLAGGVTWLAATRKKAS